MQQNIGGLTISDVGIIISGDTCYPCVNNDITISGKTYTVIYSLSDHVGNEVSKGTMS